MFKAKKNCFLSIFEEKVRGEWIEMLLQQLPLKEQLQKTNTTTPKTTTTNVKNRRYNNIN